MSDKLVRIKNRYDTAENWGLKNPVLAAGEIGIDSTNNIMKVGNGSSKWDELDVINSLHSKTISLFKKTETPKPCTLYIHSNVNDRYLITLHVDGYNDLKWIVDEDTNNNDGELTGITYSLTDGNSVGDEISIDYVYSTGYIVTGWIKRYKESIFLEMTDDGPKMLVDGYISIEIIQ